MGIGKELDLTTAPRRVGQFSNSARAGIAQTVMHHPSTETARKVPNGPCIVLPLPKRRAAIPPRACRHPRLQSGVAYVHDAVTALFINVRLVVWTRFGRLREDVQSNLPDITTSNLRKTFVLLLRVIPCLQNILTACPSEKRRTARRIHRLQLPSCCERSDSQLQ